MSSALQFVPSDYLDRPASTEPDVVPDSGFAARLVAEADDVLALLMWLSRLDPGKSWDRSSIRALLAKTLDGVDRRINEQLNEILHHPELKSLEANWRGVWLLTEQAAHDDAEGRVRVKVLDLSWRELSRDLSRAIEFDQSRLFSHIYSEEFGSPGGEPFGLLLGAYSVSHETMISVIARSKYSPSPVASVRGLTPAVSARSVIGGGLRFWRVAGVLAELEAGDRAVVVLLHRHADGPLGAFEQRRAV